MIVTFGISIRRSPQGNPTFFFICRCLCRIFLHVLHRRLPECLPGFFCPLGTYARPKPDGTFESGSRKDELNGDESEREDVDGHSEHDRVDQVETSARGYPLRKRSRSLMLRYEEAPMGRRESIKQ